MNSNRLTKSQILQKRNRIQPSALPPKTKIYFHESVCYWKVPQVGRLARDTINLPASQSIFNGHVNHRCKAGMRDSKNITHRPWGMAPGAIVPRPVRVHQEKPINTVPLLQKRERDQKSDITARVT